MIDYMENVKVPAEEIWNRIDRLKNLMKKSEIENILIMQNADLFYFGGIINQGYILIPYDGEPIYFMKRNLDFFKRYTPLKVEKLEKNSNILDYFKDNSNVGLELDVIPFNNVKYFEGMFKKKNIKILDASPIIKKVRSIKSQFELNLIRKAGMIIKNVFMELIDYIDEGKTEYEIFAFAQNIAVKNLHQGFMRMRGFNQEMYFGHILSGENGLIFGYTNAPTCGTGIFPSFPQGSSFKKIKKGEVISVDLVGCYNGYHCDQTRPFIIGDVLEKIQERFKILKEILFEIEEYIKPGVTWEESYFKIIEMVKRYEVTENFMGYYDDKVFFIGHGIGVEVDEPPFIAPKFKEEFSENMTIAIEPKLFFKDTGLIGLENTYVVTKNGLEKLTPCEDKIFLV